MFENEDFLSWFKENTPKEGLSENTTFTKQFLIDAWNNGYYTGCNKAKEWHYPSKMENGKYIEDNPIADFYPIEILALYPDKNEYEIIKYDSSWAYYKKNGESLSSKTNFVWKYL